MAEIVPCAVKVVATATGYPVYGEAAGLVVALYKLVAELRGSREMCEDLVKSVDMLLPHLTRMIDEGKINATAALSDYKGLLIQIRDFLEIHTQKNLIQRLAGHWKVKDKIKTFYVERDRIVERTRLEFQEEAANRHEHVSNCIEEVMRREQHIEAQAAKEFEELQKLIKALIVALRSDDEDGNKVENSDVMTILSDIKFQIKYGSEQSENERNYLIDTMNNIAEAKNIKIPSLSSWYISRADICFKTSPFASNETRHLHLGKLSSGAKVAVKVVNATEDDTKNRDLFNKEVTKWYPLRNPHVLPMYGANNATTPLLFVLCFAEKGNFNEYLPKNGHLFWKVFLDVARGLAYLHSRRPPIVHANLKCSNLLVLADGTGVVSDFLFAFAREDSKLSLKTQTPYTRWKAPECLQFGNSGNARVESDVYSLGMCLIEGLTGKPPFHGLEERVINDKIRAGKLPSRPDGNINDESWSLIKAMCAKEFQDRIKLGEVIRLMEILAGQEQALLGSLKCSCSSGSCSKCGKPIIRSE